MDRRQRKTRQAIFNAFTNLLAEKDFNQITVGEIIDLADVGRATFYAHFETKDFLLKELCEELFCHLFDAMNTAHCDHRHIFNCEAPSSVFLHLINHLQKNDNQILTLLSCRNNELFLQYFKDSLIKLVSNNLQLFEAKRHPMLPDSFWINHITATFLETVRWWLKNGTKESAETITEYFLLAV